MKLRNYETKKLWNYETIETKKLRNYETKKLWN